jgi:hypothetical protein
VSLFSSIFLATVSSRQAIYSAWVCLVLKPNVSLRRSQRNFTSLKILINRIFWNNCSVVSSRRIGQ